MPIAIKLVRLFTYCEKLLLVDSHDSDAVLWFWFLLYTICNFTAQTPK